jgi:hypothetical protein
MRLDKVHNIKKEGELFSLLWGVDCNSKVAMGLLKTLVLYRGERRAKEGDGQNLVAGGSSPLKILLLRVPPAKQSSRNLRRNSDAELIFLLPIPTGHPLGQQFLVIVGKWSGPKNVLFRQSEIDCNIPFLPGAFYRQGTARLTIFIYCQQSQIN